MSRSAGGQEEEGVGDGWPRSERPGEGPSSPQTWFVSDGTLFFRFLKYLRNIV